MILNDMIMIIICHSFHKQRDWFIRNIIIVRSIEDQFIPHSFEPGIVFMMFHGIQTSMFKQVRDELIFNPSDNDDAPDEPIWLFMELMINDNHVHLIQIS